MTAPSVTIPSQLDMNGYISTSNPIPPSSTYSSGYQGTTLSSTITAPTNQTNTTTTTLNGLASETNMNTNDANSKKLKENLPKKLIVAHCLILFLASIYQCVFQSLCIVFQTKLYFVPMGYIFAFFSAINIIMHLVSLKKVSFICMQLVFMYNFIFGIFVSIGGVFVNFVAIMLTVTPIDGGSTEYIYLNILMIVGFVLSIVWIIVYLIAYQSISKVVILNGKRRRGIGHSTFGHHHGAFGHRHGAFGRR